MVAAEDPDVICLQETKVEDGKFPLEPLHALGFAHIELFGMKAYHGVAILSRLPLKDHARHYWCDIDDARHQSVTLPGGIELHNVYLPSGGDEPDPEINPKFAHKLRFMTEQAGWWATQDPARPRILVGDLNVAPLETDVWSHKQLLKVVSHTPVEVEHFGRMQAAPPVGRRGSREDRPGRAPVHMVELPRAGLARLEPGPAPRPYLGHAAPGAENQGGPGGDGRARLGKGIRPRACAGGTGRLNVRLRRRSLAAARASFPYPRRMAAPQ